MIGQMTYKQLGPPVKHEMKKVDHIHKEHINNTNKSIAIIYIHVIIYIAILTISTKIIITVSFSEEKLSQKCVVNRIRTVLMTCNDIDST